MLEILFLEWSLEILSLCKEFSSDGVVGIDLAGDEILGEIPAMKGHINAFKVCCKLKPCIYLLRPMVAIAHGEKYIPSNTLVQHCQILLFGKTRGP